MAAAVLLAVYAVVVLVIVAWPTPVDAGSQGEWLKHVLKALHDRRLLVFLGYPQVEFLANVVMFVPLGLLGGVVLGRGRWGWIILAGFAASGLIETLQFFFIAGRYGTVDDVVANTLGTLVGALVARRILRISNSSRIGHSASS